MIGMTDLHRKEEPVRKKIQRTAKRILCMILVLSMGSSVYVAHAVSKETQDQIDKIKKEKEEAEQQQEETEQQRQELNNKKSEMEGYLKNLNRQASSLNEQIAILTGDIETKEAEITAKEEEIASAQAEVDSQYEDMKKRIQYMYENGQNTALTYLMAALTDGISEMLNRAEYAMSISQYDRNMLQNYKAAKQNLETQQAELKDEQEALEVLKAENEKKKEQVATQQKAAGLKISEFESLIGQKAGELNSMEELIEEKTKILNDLIKKAEEEERQARIRAAQNAASSMSSGIIAGDAQISHGAVGLSDYEIMLLATIIYCEAGNQGLEGQLAVGYVIMNRVRSGLYPNSLEAVLRQSRQFEPVGSGRFDLVLKAEQDDDIPNIVTQSCWNAARTVVNGTSNVGDSLFFRTWAPVPQLITNLENGGVPYWIIKDHVFYYYWTNYSKPAASEEPEEEDEPEQPDENDSEEPDDNEPENPDNEEPEAPEEPAGVEQPEGGEGMSQAEESGE